MNKEFYRTEIRRLTRHINMSSLLRELKIEKSNYARFMKGEDKYLGEEKLKLLISALPNKPIGLGDDENE